MNNKFGKKKLKQKIDGDDEAEFKQLRNSSLSDDSGGTGRSTEVFEQNEKSKNSSRDKNNMMLATKASSIDEESSLNYEYGKNELPPMYVDI